jgi:hypothetical protein
MPPLFISRRCPLVKQSNRTQSLKALLASAAGLRCDRAEVLVEVIAGRGHTTRMRFIYDTGADLMVIPTYVARHEGIPYREDYPGTLGSTVGGSVRCYYDFVQVRSALSGRTHRWVCAFAENLQARLLIGRAGFQDDFAAAVRGHHLIVSRRVSWRRFLGHHARTLRSRAGGEWEPI